MANELTVTVAIHYEKSTAPTVDRSLVKKITLTGTAMSQQVHTVGTSEEAMVLGEVTAAGAWVFIKNEDATNFVQVRASTAGTAIIKLKAGEAALFAFGSGITAPYLIADTASCVVSYTLISAT